jgi:hypothetical protein
MGIVGLKIGREKGEARCFTPKPISTNWREKEENMLSNLDDISIIFSFPNWSISPLTILFSLVIMRL